MNERFVLYLRTKGISQRKLSELSCVSVSSISRFCSGSPVASDRLLKMLRVCDDLSLEWLFYGSGEMIRSREGYTLNLGSFAGADVASGDSVFVKNASGVNVDRGDCSRFVDVLLEKDRLVSERDRVISERDRMITELHGLLSKR